MSDEVPWWLQEANHFLNDTFAFMNSSRSREDSISRCEDLCKALNKTWNSFFQYRRKAGKLNDKEKENETRGQRSDNQSFQALMLHGLSEQQGLEFCRQDSVRHFAEFTPCVMNHNTLLNRQYDPFNITDDVRKDASAEHRQLAKAYERFSNATDDRSLKEALLKKVSQLIYIVRSNIVHSEKTPKGPDLEKSERDRLVSNLTAKVIEDLFDNLFDRPSHRLAVYGTLAPGGTNHTRVAEVHGQWFEGTATGVIEERDGLLEFYWRLNTDLPVKVKVLSAHELEKQFNRLDRFEGPRYQRILVPVRIYDRLIVCNIYEGKQKTASNN